MAATPWPWTRIWHIPACAAERTHRTSAWSQPRAVDRNATREAPPINNDHIQRAMTSIQGTYAGAIAQVRRSFGAQPDGTAHYGIYAITDDQVVSPKAVLALEKFDPTAAR